MLLEVSAALPLDPEGVEARRAHIARSITRIDRLEAAGLAPDVALLHQARGAAARGERDRLHAALVALDDAALARGDLDTAARTGAALSRLWQGHGDARAPQTRGRSVLRSATEILGADVVAEVERAYERGAAMLEVCDDGGAAAATGAVDASGARGSIAAAYAQSARQARSAVDRDEQRRAREYLAPDGIDATLAAAVAVDGCFEVGGVLAPVRVTEHEVRVRAVRHPTPELLLAEARDVSDVPAAVIDDPRTVLLDLAAGRLLTRRYVARESHPRTRTVLRGEVRVYVLDGSGSMIGPRARVRDALLLAELATLKARLQSRERTTRVALYYRYFNDKLGPTARVDSVATAREAIGEVLQTARFGGTDIQAALVASFEQVREARAQDPDLALAQIVLVTDGEAPVDEAAVARAQAGTAGLPVGLSVIALGEENAALRALVARQRARGERAFYHFVGDEALAQIVAGEQDDGAAVHLPDAAPEPGTARARQLTEAIGALLDEVASLGRARDVEALEALDHEARARREVGLDAAAAALLTEGERARVEALHRDRRALGARFARWFPPVEPEARGGRAPAPGTTARADLDAARVALATVAEVISVVGGSELARQADAIDLLERLLPDARLSPARYEAVLARHADAVRGALRAVHAAVRFGLAPGA